MILTINMVYEALHSIKHRCIISSSKISSFKALRIFVPNEKNYERDFLYIDLNNSISPSLTNLDGLTIVVQEGETDFDQIVDTQMCNFIVIDSQIVLAKVLNQFISLFNTYETWDRMVDESIFDNGSLDGIMSLSEKFFTNPMIIIDLSFKVIGHTKTIYTDNDYFNETIAKMRLSKASVENLIKRRMLQKEDQYISLKKISPPNMANCNQYLKSIYFKNYKIATFLYFCVNGEPSQGELDFISLFIHKVEKLFLRDNIDHFCLQERFDYFLSDLLENKYSSVSDMEIRAELINMDFNAKYVLYSFYFGEATSRISSFIVDSFKDISPFYRVTVYDNRIIILIPLETQHYNTHILEEKQKFIEKFLTQYEGYMGISGVFHSLKYARDEYHKANAAIEIGLMLKPDERVFMYRDYYIYHLMMSSSSSINLNTLYYRKIKKLITYDEKHSTDNTYILKTFLNNDRNASKTATLCNLHRNSVLYRIKQIESILNVSLDDSEVRLKLILAYYALDLLDKIEKK